MDRTINKRWLFLLGFLLLLLISSGSLVRADETPGWNKEGKQIFYNIEGETGIEKAVGLVKIASKYYFFNEEGKLQTGWVRNEEGVRYFKKVGSFGKIGRMYVGLQKIGGKRFFFNKKTGLMARGKTEVKKGVFYYFNMTGSVGKMGAALTKKWKKISGNYYYFGSDGKMASSRWVGKYYVDEDGKRLYNTITPDGYLLNEKGIKASKKKVNGLVEIGGKTFYYAKSKKKFYTKRFVTVGEDRYYFGADGAALTGLQTISGAKYFFDEKGILQTGLVTIDNKKYYFQQDGKMLVGAAVDGYTSDKDGVVTKMDVKAKILVWGGHGQGDSGAVGCGYQEQNLTRELAKLIYEELKKMDGIDVTLYNPAYDLFRHNYNALVNNGLSITGNGAKASAVKKALKTDPVIPDLTQFDYALEVHFNATGESLKDPGGNGSYKGVSFYVSTYKPEKKKLVDWKILNKIVGLGFKQFSTGVTPRSDLTNCKVFQELGVDYALLETGFIDDLDDIRFYQNNKKRIAKAVAEAIADAYRK